METKMERMESKIENMESKMGTMEVRMGTMEAKIETITMTMATKEDLRIYDARLTRVEEQIGIMPAHA